MELHFLLVSAVQLVIYLLLSLLNGCGMFQLCGWKTEPMDDFDFSYY